MTIQRIAGEYGAFEIYVAAHADAPTFTFDVTAPRASIAGGGPVHVCQNLTRAEMVEHVRQCQAALGESGETGGRRATFKYAMDSGPHPSLTVACPTCGSPTGHYCNDDDGGPTDRPHDARRAAAGTSSPATAAPASASDGDARRPEFEERLLDERAELQGQVTVMREAVAHHARTLDDRALGHPEHIERHRDSIDNELYNAVIRLFPEWWEWQVPGMARVRELPAGETGERCWVCNGRGRRSSWVSELYREVESACPDCNGTGILPPSGAAGESVRARCPKCGELVPGAEPGDLTCCADAAGRVDMNIELAAAGSVEPGERYTVEEVADALSDAQGETSDPRALWGAFWDRLRGPLPHAYRVEAPAHHGEAADGEVRDGD